MLPTYLMHMLRVFIITKLKSLILNHVSSVILKSSLLSGENYFGNDRVELPIAVSDVIRTNRSRRYQTSATEAPSAVQHKIHRALPPSVATLESYGHWRSSGGRVLMSFNYASPLVDLFCALQFPFMCRSLDRARRQRWNSRVLDALLSFHCGHRFL